MSKSPKITFLLPGSATVPAGGFKVVYEYANHLVRRGYRVTIVHPATPLGDNPWKVSAKTGLVYYRRMVDKRYLPLDWFPLEAAVEALWVPALAERYIPDADILVATSWETAEWAVGYSESKGVKNYLIQHLETWGGPASRVLATWKAPMKKIVIARWLLDVATEMGETAVCIPNGLDFSRFGIEVPIEARSPSHVMMLYHHQDWKGSKDGLEALTIARQRVPELRATLFGVPSTISGAPSWIEYHHKPSQKHLRFLYNQAAIFIAPNWTEGWGLPQNEAMMCGAALVATDTGGHREYAIHEQTALVSDPKDAPALAANVLRLIHDQGLRVKLAKAGGKFLQQFTWKRATDAFEAVIAETRMEESAYSFNGD
jgi:glycosyltransferase involved in cell wall biosynthesis